MRMLLGGVSLLLALAVLGLLAKTQLKHAGTASAPAAVSANAASAIGVDPPLAATPVRDLPRQVQDDLVRAMQAPPTRGDDSR